VTALQLMTKAMRAAESAQLLPKSGGRDGACKRAYYAMFDAAMATLLASSAPVEAEVARTHGGLISAFSYHLVKTGQVPKEFGRALNWATEIRLVADYQGEAVDQTHAEWAVAQTAAFVQAIRDRYLPGSDSSQ